MMTWETVIGLEVHVQLATASKMFCGCSTQFGDSPNSNVCPICLGLPGALPSPNGQALRLATRAAHALGLTVHSRSIFARKNYFYPDLPKGYQISQFDRPLATDGKLRIDSTERGSVEIGIQRLHVEEDAGKSLHDRFPGKTAVDLNRAGVPLVEIVSGPDLRSPAEARAYLTALKQILIYAEVSECSMEKGSLRVDANISLRRPGDSSFGAKTEIKNMNSFANVERAIEAERERQRGLLESGQTVESVTLLFNAVTGQVKQMRSKAESHDYRYFTDPDLPPLVLSREWIEAEREALPELPEAKRQRLVAQYRVSDYDARVISSERAIADYFEAVAATGADPKTAANWVLGDVMTAFNESGAFPVNASKLAGLIELVAKGTVSHQAAKKVFTAMVTTSEEPLAAAQRLGLTQVRDENVLETWVDEVLAACQVEVGRYRGGETKLMAFFVGQVMKKSQGKADPKAVPQLLAKKLAG